MGRRPWTATLACVVSVVTAAAAQLGFGMLLLGRSEVDGNMKVYFARHGYGNAEYDSHGWLAAEFVAGGLLAVTILVLASRTLQTPRRGVATWVALCAGLPLALIQLADGLNNLRPGELVRAIFPSWFFPLNLAMGVLTLVGYGAAAGLLLLPRSQVFFRRAPS